VHNSLNLYSGSPESGGFQAIETLVIYARVCISGFCSFETSFLQPMVEIALGRPVALGDEVLRGAIG
jgi:hypothetical protein